MGTCAADGPLDSLSLVNCLADSQSTSAHHHDILVITLNCPQHEHDEQSVNNGVSGKMDAREPPHAKPTPAHWTATSTIIVMVLVSASI